MSESIKKNTEMNELLTEAKDMELGTEAAAGLNITKVFKCGQYLTISAECRADHKSCNPSLIFK